jgi:hypothetical protein
MTADRETVHALRSLFEDDVNVLPDRVFDTVLADLPVTRQERPLFGPGRGRAARLRTFRYAMVVAVAVVAFAVGFGLYRGLGTSGGAVPPPSSPSPSVVAPSATPDAKPSPSLKPGTATPPAGWPTPEVLVPTSPLPSPGGSALPADLIGRQYVTDPIHTQGIQAEVMTLRGAYDPHCLGLFGGRSTCFTILWTPNYPNHINDPAVRGPARIVNGKLVLGWAMVPSDPNCEGESATYSISADGWTLDGVNVPDCLDAGYVRY